MGVLNKENANLPWQAGDNWISAARKEGSTELYYYYYRRLLSQAFSSGTSLEPAVIPTAQASSFTLQYFPYYVWCSKYIIIIIIIIIV
jgi:hypothetical protein